MHYNITIKISTASLAFRNQESSETARILRSIVDWLTAGQTIVHLDSVFLRDFNGNKVGTIQVTEVE